MNLRQVRKKTKSVSNVKKITRSMQLVSAIKMKKSQTAAIEAKPYQSHLESMIKKIVGKIDPSYSSLFLPKENAKYRSLIIVISSNKGLCGSFNFDLFRYISKNVEMDRTDFVVIGKKAASFILKMGGNIVADYSSSQPLNQVTAVFGMAMDLFLKGEYRQVGVLYNRFISTLHTEPSMEMLLPVSSRFESMLEEKQTTEYLIEPSPQAIIDTLLRSYIEEKIRNVIVQSEAGEHSARMVAMKNATDNANDVIYNLTLLGNKLRQEKITNELLDMVTAKESVEVEN